MTLLTLYGSAWCLTHLNLMPCSLCAPAAITHNLKEPTDV